jgi:hypothetical protein
MGDFSGDTGDKPAVDLVPRAVIVETPHGRSVLAAGNYALNASLFEQQPPQDS